MSPASKPPALGAGAEDQALQVMILGRSIIRLVRQGVQQHSQGALTHIQYRALSRLARQPSGLGELAQGMQVRLPTASCLVDGLEQAGWVDRSRDARDRRRVELLLTAKGLALREKVRQGLRQELAKRLAKLDARQARDFKAGMRVLQQLFPVEGGA
jgi:DNA-binding MarR family transcriptional regulator